ncbi:MAG TPA: hypothetical protein PKE29_13240 [Phycisphaerales bacterium]|nr:hypothetical protein [Phycisphaerales bacterium]
MSDTSDTDDVYSECLASARLTALRALLQIVNTTDDPVEKRHAATAILRAPDPTVARRSAPDSSRVPRHSVAGSARIPQRSAPDASPQHSESPSHPIALPLPRSTHEIDHLIASAADHLNESPFLDPFANCPDPPDPNDFNALSQPCHPAAILAASAGRVPPPICRSGVP